MAVEKILSMTYFPGEGHFGAVENPDTTSFGDRYHQVVTHILGELKANINALEAQFADGENNLKKIKDTAASGQIQNPAETLGREENLLYLKDDMKSLADMFSSILSTYGDMAKMIDELHRGQMSGEYILHRQSELLKQNQDFNILLADMNIYMQKLSDLLEEEYKNLAHIEKLGSEDLGQQNFINSLYQNLLQGRQAINEKLEKRTIFIHAVIDSLRKDVAKVKMTQLEEEAIRRSELLRANRRQEQIEDVHDYEDLEGNYQHIYDEEGNLIETIDGGDGSNKSGIQTIIISIIVCVAIGIAYYFYKH